ncbi:glycosyltransferase [Candidatus Peribacteria bacterium]|nr:glycosyltransferase [Candidatus Peribacteria bacterium]
MSENVIIHVQLEYKELAIFLHERVDIIICPSKFETYGNIAQEAIALGTPVILSKNM